MKTTITRFALAFICLSTFVSCEREFSCTCESSTGGKSYHSISAKNSSEATSKCDNYEGQEVETNSGPINTTTNTTECRLD